MPCFASTIVRIKFVKQYEKENTDFVRVWAIGGYSIEHEYYDIDMTLFVPVNLSLRDLKTQAVFEKDNFYCVGGKITPTWKKQKSKVSQEMPKEVKNDENAIIQMLVTDYISEECNFTMKIVFLYLNPSSSASFNRPEFDSSNDSQSSKCVRIEDDDEEELTKDNAYHQKKNSDSCEKGKEHIGRSLHSTLRSYDSFASASKTETK
ncbi:7517_t:CDS:2 [Dentiscutata erythropus]|uniref:7517_t:CDS:1 n=1 Tax=Dentiscutata erythropus TaxID=1348616 RepID=A0A9N9I8U3_9GLOM|nr:7517_t:CDS:2 [Dentiscutata erythropus]